MNEPLAVHGDGPFVVSVKCVVFEPPPPGYRECPECMVHHIESEQVLIIKAPIHVKEGLKLQLEILIEDKDGDKKLIEVKVDAEEPYEQEPNFMSAD